jgi:plastocyanin
MRIKVLWLGSLVLATALTAVTCGGGSSTPTSPSPSPSPTATPSPGPSPTPTPTPSAGGTTITISAAGVVSPKVLTVPAGTRVTFVNNDTRPHEMDSNPHPEHTDCIEINQVGFMTAGQTKLTGNLPGGRTCGYHDHNRDSDTNLQGTIVVQ